ncbi:MAG: dTDP-4-dehydrorhamnose 3,5-epimerase [Cyclobacteriaceae bacterium]
MKVLPSKIEGLLTIEPAVFEDHRGYFYEGFNNEKLKAALGADFTVRQLNFSKSSRGVLRGLHFQHPPFDQSKLISCNAGEILDVVVDMRQGSPTYGQHEKVLLSGDNKLRFFVPSGFAHGFLVLSETAEIMYAVDQNYSAAHDAGISYNDPALSIDWGVDQRDLTISDKDKKLPTLDAVDNQFKYHV